MLTALQGYKTYIIGILALLYAAASLWGGVMDVNSATSIALAALGLMGVRSGITTAIIQILQAQGHDIPSTGGQVAIKRAIEAAKKVSPVFVGVLMVSMMMAVTACTNFPVKQDPQSILNETEAGFALAEAAYDGICAVTAPPNFCTDAEARTTYANTKLALEQLFATAQAAINASHNTDSAAIDALLAQISQDWASYNKIVNTVQAKNALLRGVAYKPVPLYP